MMKMTDFRAPWTNHLIFIFKMACTRVLYNLCYTLSALYDNGTPKYHVCTDDYCECASCINAENINLFRLGMRLVLCVLPV